MKSTLIVKLFLLAIPLIAACAMYLLNSRGAGIGGGSYDLTNLYYAVFAGIYYIAFCTVLLMAKISRENKFLLAVAAILLIVHLVYLYKLM